MRKSYLLNCVITLPIAAVALAISTGPVFADEEIDELEKIVVHAPIEVEREAVKNDTGALAKTEIIKLTRPVGYSDLDLADKEDVRILDMRIEAIALDSCERLSEMFPFDRSDRKEMNRCMKDAVASALDQKERAIAAAN